MQNVTSAAQKPEGPVTRNRFFSKGLYIESLKQLRVIGIIAVIILELGAILIPMAIHIEAMSAGAEAVIGRVVNLGEMNVLLILMPLIFTPIMVLYMFRFLNKRNSSDFYHAVPHSRTSVFISLFAAVATWIAAAIIVSILTSVAASWILSDYIVLNMSSVFAMGFNMIAGSLYVAAAVALAMSITGNAFSNVIVSGLIIFMPRLLMQVIIMTLTGLIPMIPQNGFWFILDPKYNIIFNLFTMTSDSATNTMMFWPGGIYTLIVGIVFLVLALILFRIRKSEAAEQAASSRKMQTVFRLLVTMLICLIPCTLILNNMKSTSSDAEQGLIFSIIVLYIVALLVYFLYEIISTKGVKTIVKTFPALVILAAMNFVYIFGTSFAYDATMKSIPIESGDIQSVSFLATGTNDAYSAQHPSYSELKVKEIVFENNRLNEIISESLNNTKEEVEAGNYYNRLYNQEDMMEQTVRIKAKNGTVVRNILVKDKYWDEMNEIMKSKTAFKDAYLVLPEYGNQISVYTEEVHDDENKIKNLYETLQKELKTVDFAKWYMMAENYMQIPGDSQNTAVLEYGLYIDGSVGTELYSSYIPYTSLTPKTTNLYMKYCNETNYDKGMAAVEKFMEDQDVNLNMDMEIYYTDENGTQGMSIDKIDKEMADFIENLKTKGNREPDIQKSVITIRVNDYSTAGEYLHYVFYLDASGLTLPNDFAA